MLWVDVKQFLTSIYDMESFFNEINSYEVIFWHIKLWRQIIYIYMLKNYMRLLPSNISKM